MDLKGFFHTGLTYLAAVWSVGVSVPIIAVGNLRGKKGRSESLGLIRWWARQFIAAAGVDYTVLGLENIQPGQNYILMPNHRSHLDGPLLIVTTPFFFSFVIKQSLANIPIWGWAARTAGYVPVIRDDRESAKKKLASAAELLKRGESMLVFPEGSRAPGHAFLPFKKGGIILAIQTGVPILPAAISGTGDILPKNGLTVTPGPAIIRYGKPIETKGLTYEDRNELLAKVEKSIKSMYP